MSAYALSTFSGRLPEEWQDAGLWVSFGLGTLFLVGLCVHAIRDLRREQKVQATDLIMLGLAGMVLSAALTLSGFVWQRWGGNQHTTKPVELSDESLANPLRWDFLGKEPNFLMGRTTDYGVQVEGFQATGQNETGGFIKGLSGSVVSVRTGKTYPLQIVDHNKLVPLEGYGIPDGNQFMVRAPFFDGAGKPVVQFLSEFGALNFVFEHDGVSFGHKFSAEQVEAQAQWLEQELKPKPKRSAAGGIPLVEPERRFTPRTPKELLALYDGKTKAQGDVLIKPHLGMWLLFEGTVTWIGTEDDGTIALVQTDNAKLSCRFNHEWDDHMLRLKNGDRIQVQGRIDGPQGPGELHLRDCEITE